MSKECIQCGVGFIAGSNAALYCPVCRLRECTVCGAMFYWIKRDRAFPVRFCSKKCYGRSLTEFGLRAKEKSPTYIDGRSLVNQSVRLSAEYRRWRKSVFERDNYTCVECGIRGVELHADHIEPFAKNPNRRLDLANGRTLCVPCHEKTPSYKGNYHRNYANS